MRVVLHIGAQKTGSSAIQVGLARNRDALAKIGCLYPTADNDKTALQGGITSGNGMELAALLSPSQAFAAHFKKLDQVADIQNLARTKGIHSILYSSELFMFAQRAALQT